MGALEIRLLYNIWNFLLFGWGRYTLFKTKLRLPLKWVLALVVTVTALCSGVWYFFLQERMGYQMYRFATILVLFLISCIIIKAPFPKHALSYLTIFTVSAILDTLAMYVHVLFPGAHPNLDILLLLIVQPVALIPLIKTMGKVTELLSATPNNRVWWYLCLNGFATVLLCLTTTAHHLPDAELLASRFYLFFAMFGMLAATVWVQKSMYDTAKTEAALAISQNQVQMQQAYYDNLISQMEEIRHIRHDLRHHRAALMSIIKSGNAEAAAEYIRSWNVVDEASPVTGNLVADSLVSFHYNWAKEMGFSLDVEMALPRLPGITEPDLCVIIGNLLQNAMEAQEHLPPEQRFVRICAKGDENSFTLAVDNRFAGEIRKAGDKLLTSKDTPGHGLGLSSVRAVCKKYGGILQLEQKDDLFLAGVVIGL